MERTTLSFVQRHNQILFNGRRGGGGGGGDAIAPGAVRAVAMTRHLCNGDFMT